MSADDVLVTDERVNPADFAEGASIARERAIEGYQLLVKSHQADAEAVDRLRELIADETCSNGNGFANGG